MQRVLYLEHNVDGTLGGSHVCLLDICRLINRKSYSPVVWFYEANILLPEFTRCGTRTVVSRPPGPITWSHAVWWVPGYVKRRVQSLANLLRVVVVNVIWWMRQLRRHRIDIVHLNNNSFGDLDLQLAARILHIPVVAHQRGFSGTPGPLGLRLANMQQSIIAISAAVREDLIGKGIAAQLIHLVHDGIDPDRLQSVATAARLQPVACTTVGPRTIGIVGNVKRWKGQLTVVQAMSQISEKFPDVECWIIGSESDSEYVAELKDLVRSLGLDLHVKFLGFRRDSWLLMRDMAVVIHASITPEPFGIVILEAMHHAKPVVASAHGGPLDIVIDGQTGYLTPPGDADVLASRVISLLADPELSCEMGQRGRERYLENFTAHKTVGAIEAIYATISTA